MFVRQEMGGHSFIANQIKNLVFSHRHFISENISIIRKQPKLKNSNQEQGFAMLPRRGPHRPPWTDRSRQRRL